RRRLLQRFHQPLPFRHARTGGEVPGKYAAEIKPVGQLENHHEAPAQLMDVHPLHSGGAQAVEHLRPHTAMIVAIGLDDTRIVLEVEGEHTVRHWFSTPPSTGYAWPVMKLASSEHRYSARAATSSGVPMRPTGW